MIVQSGDWLLEVISGLNEYFLGERSHQTIPVIRRMDEGKFKKNLFQSSIREGYLSLIPVTVIPVFFVHLLSREELINLNCKDIYLLALTNVPFNMTIGNYLLE